MIEAEIAPSRSSRSSSSPNGADQGSSSGSGPGPGSSSNDDESPSFVYDLDIFNLCKSYLEEKNHHGLALIARQKGVPPFLRYKIWPILLKYHPFVINPFLQPDSEAVTPRDSETSSSDSSSSDSEEEEIRAKIKKHLGKYLQRARHNSEFEITDVESQMFNTLLNSVLKFTLKWGQIIKYDEGLTWLALNLAEWFPPIDGTNWVLVGRDNVNNKSVVKDLFADYSNYIDHLPDKYEAIKEIIYDNNSGMSFHDVYERLVLVMLHSPEERNKGSKGKIDKTILPLTGGTIEDRVSFFIYCLRQLFPELSKLFQEEQILNRFGNNDDQWLIWWLKYCGAKVWSKADRGRIWDLMLGWRLKNPRKNTAYYHEKLHVTNECLDKLGPDIFWTVGEENEGELKLQERSSSFRDLINGLNDFKLHEPNENPLDDGLPFSKLDPHIELIFISLALLRSKENTLVELDQHEIRQFLSRLPSNSHKYKHKQNVLPSSTDSNLISNDSETNHKVDFMDKILNEAGESWRKYLWLELNT